MDVTLANTAQVDAFGRARVSTGHTLFSSSAQYSTQPLLWEYTTAGSGAVAHVPAESAVRMRVTNANGDKVVRQSRQYHLYRPGVSQEVAITGIMATAKAGLRQRWGLFDAANGVFLEQVESGLRLVVRSSTSGSPVDFAVPQSQWNLDRLDGTGDSRVSLDVTKGTPHVFDFQWLGMGRIRWGVSYRGAFIGAHEFSYANRLGTVYATTMTLPVRYEIETVAADGPAGNSDMKAVCSTVITEGDERTYGQLGAASNGTTAVAVTTRRPVVSIAPSATFNSIANRSMISPVGFELLASGDVFWEIVRGGTLATTPSFASAGANSAVDVDVASTTITNGDRLAAGYAAAGSGSAKGSTALSFSELGITPLPLTLDIAGANPIPLTLVATSVGGGSINVYGSLSWIEQR